MRIGLYSDSLAGLSVSEFLDFAVQNGIACVEFGTGNWSSAPHLDLERMLAEADMRARFLTAIRDRGLAISTLNCSGNPLHPGPTGRQHAQTIRDTIRLAELLGVDRVVTMSGLPGGPGDRHPNWITTSWPPENLEILDWQWNEVLPPFWRDLAKFAAAHSVRLCIEMHGSQAVYNVETFWRLAEITGDQVGLNFDPSHLMWMGADPIAAARAAAGRIYHVHAKDTRLEVAAAANGRLDAKPVMPVEPRSWNFVAVGRGHDAAFWRELARTLRDGGYDDVMSIENEDHSLAPETAVNMAIACLNEAIA